MAKHQITINIVNKQTKEQEKREILNESLGKKDSVSPDEKLLKKQSKEKGESSSKGEEGGSKGATAANKAQVANSAISLVPTVYNSALNMIDSVGDYGVEARRIQSTVNLGKKISSIAVNAAASGPLWWATLIFEVANWAVEMGENNIQWNHQQQMNNIAAERASNRLGIVSTAGNRNMKL